MKKICYAILLFCSLLLLPQTAYADSNYTSFESIELSSGKLLKSYTKSEYKKYYKKVKKSKFMGWRTYKVYKDIECNYVTETLFSYYNDGYTPIEYEYSLDRKTTSKLSLSASGSIGISSNKSGQSFKNNLNGSLKLSADYNQSDEINESYEIKLEVDPKTQVDLYIAGTGLITNGVAARYVFFIRVNKGGFEAFVVTSQYHRLEKKRI